MTRKPAKRFYGYGIVGKSGKPWWSDCCVCQDRGPMLDVARDLNDDDVGTDGEDRPYQVVRLFYMSRGKR